MLSNPEHIEIFILLIVVVIIFLSLVAFLIYFIFLYQKKQRRTEIEQKELQLFHESELLKTHLEVQEQTMQTIASDLHDNIGQLLSLTSLTLNSINLKEPEKSEQKINTSLSLVNRSIKDLRSLAKLLQGEQLVETGLGKAIKQELVRLKQICNYKLKIRNRLLDIAISSPAKDLIILRLFQEIINNIIKHAQATHIEINTYIANEILYLKINENGIGFDYEEIKNRKRGIGLYTIHKRVEIINGKIHIESTSSRGTLIAIEIPYP